MSLNRSDNSSPFTPLVWIKDAIDQLRLAWQLFMDPRVHWGYKTIPVAAMIYILSPLDFVPGVIPILGQLDDLGVLFLGVKFFIELAPAEIVEEHLAALHKSKETTWKPAEGIVVDVEPENSSSEEVKS